MCSFSKIENSIGSVVSEIFLNRQKRPLILIWIKYLFIIRDMRLGNTAEDPSFKELEEKLKKLADISKASLNSER